MFYSLYVIIAIRNIIEIHLLMSDGRGTVTKLFSQEKMQNKETIA